MPVREIGARWRELFVSYTSDDRSRVALLVAARETDGVSLWWDALGGTTTPVAHDGYLRGTALAARHKLEAASREFDAAVVADPSLIGLKPDPLLVPLRQDPRFTAWLRKIGFA